MDKKEILKSFFEEHTSSTSEFFLYKDKKLLEQGNYKGFAREQLAKCNRIFLGSLGGFLIGVLYGLWYLHDWTESGSWLMLAVGAFSLSTSYLILFYATKEYYSIKSSMRLLLALLENEKPRETSG